MSSYNIIGDIAGNYKTFSALQAKMPEGQTIAVGDLMDRGPNSKQVVEYFMMHPEHETLKGNHEDLMIDYVRYGGRRYGLDCWKYNGGHATINSWGQDIPSDVIDFLETRKLYVELEIEGKKYFISHAFPHKKFIDGGMDNVGEEEFIWSRLTPVESESLGLQIAGHNSHYGLREFRNDSNQLIGICIDTSRSKVLTGLHLPTLKIYQQEYID